MLCRSAMASESASISSGEALMMGWTLLPSMRRRSASDPHLNQTRQVEAASCSATLLREFTVAFTLGRTPKAHTAIKIMRAAIRIIQILMALAVFAAAAVVLIFS